MAQSVGQEDFSILFSLTLPHVKITYDPAAYQELYRTYKVVPLDAGEDYWLHLPDYLIARCPLCGAEYHERIDTHSLKWLGQNPTSKPTYVGSPKYQTINCAHFVGVTVFVNLNGLLPSECNVWSCYMGDVPTITPSLLPDDIPAAAVMHSLPVCRIENGVFVPRYSLYMITYFASDPTTIWQRRKTEMDRIAASRAANGVDFAQHISWVNTACACRENPLQCNLSEWVRKDKLYWLDLHSRELPLHHGKAEEFPYANISGYSWHKWRYPKGQIQLMPCL